MVVVMWGVCVTWPDTSNVTHFFFLSYVTQGGNPEQCLVHGDLPKRFIGTGKMVRSVDGC